MKTPAITSIDTTYIVGLDIGDGESCLAWADIGGRAEPTVYRRPITDESSILTAIARGPHTDQPIIGERTLLEGGAIQFVINFKEPPAPDSAVAPDAVQFAQVLLHEFFASHPDIAASCHVLIGHPTGWPEEAVGVYQRFLAASDFQFSLLPESQSALVHVYERNHERPGPALLDSVLVVDIGSSTTDFTVITDLTPVNLPIGADFGCRIIDEELEALITRDLTCDAEFRKAMDHPCAPSLLRLICRRAKESRFQGRPFITHDLENAHIPAAAAIFNLATGRLRSIDITHIVDRKDGWGDRFRDLLGQVRGSLPAPVARVVLTGGGSRMPLTRSLCQEVFPEATIDCDTEPSFSVAKGLASTGRYRVRIERFHHEMRDVSKLPQVQQIIQEQLIILLEDERKGLLERLREAKPAKWTRLIETPPDLQRHATKLTTALDRQLSPLVEEICQRYGIHVEDHDLSITLVPPRPFMLEFVHHALGDLLPSIHVPSSTTTQAARVLARIAPKAVTKGRAVVAATGVAGASKIAARVFGRATLYGGAGVIVIGGVAWTINTLRNARQRQRALGQIENLSLSEDSILTLVHDLTDEMGRVAEQRTASLVRLISDSPSKNPSPEPK